MRQPLRIGGIRLASLVLLLAAAAPSLGQVRVIAVRGEPFGVAQVTLPIEPVESRDVVNTNGYYLQAAEGRQVLYPAFGHRRVLGLLREVLGVRGDNSAGTVTAFFLFRGEDPFRVTLHLPKPKTVMIAPVSDQRLHDRLLRRWWRQYTTFLQLRQREVDYPPIIHRYLTAMLADRLQLPIRRRPGEDRPIEQTTLQLVLNVESLRLQTLEDTLRGVNPLLGPAAAAVPQMQWPARPPLEGTAPATEKIAAHVPPECFYIRFGTFDNYLWARHLLEKNGGSIQQMVTLRGHNAMLNEKTQEQLGLRETRLAELFGRHLISDVAMIGRDTYLREGAAVGVLFESASPLLRGELAKQQQQAIERLDDDRANIKQVQIEGRPVAFAHTPDNRMRSFYVVDGDYHLVTNSRNIVERFLQVGRNGGGLAATADFQRARQRFPLESKAAAWAYLSPEFFRGLVSPQYQIELRRRLKAVTDLELVQMAEYAARNEEYVAQSLADLIAGGFLPEGMRQRSDNSRLERDDDGRWIDSLRGARGRFLPVADVPLGTISASEAEQYQRLTEFQRRTWEDMDPLVMEVTRQLLPAETGRQRERVAVRIELLPFNRAKYGNIASMLGEPTTRMIEQAPDDAITVQAILKEGKLSPDRKPHHLFVGVQDVDVPVTFAPGRIYRLLQIVRTAPAYLGAWPELGLLRMLPLVDLGGQEGPGLRRLPLGIWQMRTEEGFSVLALDQATVLRAAEHLAVVDADEPAQIRVHVADLTQTRIRDWFAAIDFQQAFQTSVANTRLLHALITQLGVPAAEALSAAESILGVRLLCPLGGEYQLAKSSSGLRWWQSTAWPGDQGAFVSPLMAWFRGMDARVTLDQERLRARLVVDIEQDAPESTFRWFRWGSSSSSASPAAE